MTVTREHNQPAAPDLAQLAELVAIALALGMTVPAAPGMTVWLADVLDTAEDETRRSQLGIFTSRDAAYACARTWVLDEWDESSSPPWFEFSPNEADLEIPAAQVARTAWLAERSDEEVVESYFAETTWHQLRVYAWTVRG